MATPPPVRGGRQPKILFATQAASRPPRFVLFTTGFLEAGYRRFIERRLREEFGFVGTPVHGEVRHLVANAELAVRTGVPRERVVVADDGVVVDLVGGVARVVGAVECGYVYVDGASVGEITDADLKDRRILGEEGFISIVVVVDSSTGKVVAGPDIHARGFAEGDAVFDRVKPRIADALAEAAAGGAGDNYQLQQVVRRVVGRWVNESYRRRPMIIPLVVEA